MPPSARYIEPYSEGHAVADKRSDMESECAEIVVVALHEARGVFSVLFLICDRNICIHIYIYRCPIRCFFSFIIASVLGLRSL